MTTTPPLDAFPSTVLVDVRWGDMDAMGHVNNARYFTFLESARIRFFEIAGLDRVVNDRGCGISLASASCNFRREVKYPSTLSIGTGITKIGNSSVTLRHALYDQSTGELMADAQSVVVWVNYVVGKSQPLPDALREALQKLLVA